MRAVHGRRGGGVPGSAILRFALFVAGAGTAGFCSAAPAASPKFRVTIDEAMWSRWGFQYPATYEFRLSGVSPQAQGRQCLFDAFMELANRTAGVLDTYPEYPGLIVIGKAPRLADLELERFKICRHIFSQPTDIRRCAVWQLAEELHCQVYLFAIDPADVAAGASQSLLQTD